MDSLELTNMKDHDPSIRFERLPSRIGELKLQTAFCYPGDDGWTAEAPASAWTPADVARAAAWFARHTARDHPISAKAVWFAVPAVGFRVIDRNADSTALDVCWTHSQDAPHPLLDGTTAEPAGDGPVYIPNGRPAPRDVPYGSTNLVSLGRRKQSFACALDEPGQDVGDGGSA